MAKFVWQDGTLVSKAKVEIGGTIYEVDPEEYSGSTPLSASNLNAMVDSTYSDLKDYADEKQTYSTDETKIGTWIDGKPLYRKVISFTTPAGNTDYTINTGASIDTITKLYGGIKEASGGITPIPTAIDFSGTIYTTSFRASNSNIYYKGNSAYGSKPAFAIIEYTKTTD